MRQKSRDEVDPPLQLRVGGSFGTPRRLTGSGFRHCVLVQKIHIGSQPTEPAGCSQRPARTRLTNLAPSTVSAPAYHGRSTACLCFANSLFARVLYSPKDLLNFLGCEHC